MCNLYVSPQTSEAERFWRIKESKSRRPLLPPMNVSPRKPGTFIRRARQGSAHERELVVGRWGLIPPFSKTSEPKDRVGRPLSTNNARSEDLSWKPSFKAAWADGKRCIIPASSFNEPNWETGKNQWWQFRRADGTPWGLAGLWNTWTNQETGEVHESYTMLTLNADNHPLMNRMHKPEVDKETKLVLPADKQDKRSVIPIEFGDVDLWLAGTVEEARALLRLAPVEAFDAGPVAV
jgi:putative SOS response-associated peptidase YedK